VNVWAQVFLGVIAVATLAMAVVQVGVIVVAVLLARRVDRLADQVEHELKPVFAHLDTIGREASKAAGLATAQVERVDRLFQDLSERIEQTVSAIQSSLVGPAREGKALMAALRAAMAAVREARRRARARQRVDDEDALFI
jgi:hypothetical protein